MKIKIAKQCKNKHEYKINVCIFANKLESIISNYVFVNKIAENKDGVIK